MGEGQKASIAQPAYRSLVADMRLALLSEIGARAIYDHLGRRLPDGELRSLLAHFNDTGTESVARLRDLMIGLGARARRTSLRRRALARGLALASRFTGRRLVLRICMNAEQTVGRWYAEYAIFLLRIGDRPRAQVCSELAEIKRRNAQVLSAWVDNLVRP
jgi:hypothetical protein